MAATAGRAGATTVGLGHPARKTCQVAAIEVEGTPASDIKGDLKMRLAWMVVVLGFAATGCAPKETAYMKNPATGEVAACGPYYKELEIQDAAKQWCVDDYARRGYVPAPSP